MARPKQIVAMGGGGFLMEDSPLLDEYVLAASGTEQPKTLLLPTASGDADALIVKFYRAFHRLGARPSHCELFRRDASDLRKTLLDSDVIYVGGGNTANMLAIWRLHGVDEILREAWQAGVVLAGLSAGSLCWFECGVSDSFGPLVGLADGLGLLAGSHCPHYDGEPKRRETFERLIASGELSAGIAAPDSVALHYHGTELGAVVSSRPNLAAEAVSFENGELVCERLPARWLGDSTPRS